MQQQVDVKLDLLMNISAVYQSYNTNYLENKYMYTQYKKMFSENNA